MTADPARVAAARQALAHLGVTLADLRSDTPDGTRSGPDARSGAARALRMPTVVEYLPRVAAAAGPGAARTYGSYWARMATAWGARPVDSIAASDIEAQQRQAIATARQRRTSRGGRHAANT